MAHRFVSRFGRRLLLPFGFMAATAIGVYPLLGRGASEAERVAQVLLSAHERIRNGGFEQSAEWFPDPGGFQWAPGEGREAGTAISCRNERTTDASGAFQQIPFKPPTSFPLIVSGWSRCEGVDGARDGGYALYVDVEHADGTSLTGLTASFDVGSHSWQRVELRVPQIRPIHALTLHCLFRGHRGRVWFDDLSVVEASGNADAIAFQGVPVHMHAPTLRVLPDPSTTVVSRRNGLSLSWRDNRIASFKVDGKELAGQDPSGFFIRDVVARSDFLGFRDGRCGELGLDLERRFLAADDHLAIEGRLVDRTRKDRQVTLVFALPLDLNGWRWGDDARRSRRIEGRDEFSNVVPVGCGATGTLSRYPFSAIYSDKIGLGLALDMARPSQARLSYHPATKQLLVAYDFALIHDSLNSPGRADFRFVLYRFNPSEGFRGALRSFYEIFMDSFVARCRDAGIWLPFQKASEIKDWKDFGFVFHEGAEDAAFDEAHGLRAFRYSEPGAWWMALPREAPRTEEEALRVLEKLEDDAGKFARAVRTAGVKRDDGKPALELSAAPWCDGAVWSMNPSPSLPQPNAASLWWNEGIRERTYGKDAPGRVDGEFLDSLEGYRTAELDFDREHLRQSTVTPSFSLEAGRPVLFKGQPIFEYVRWVARETRAMNRLTFGNGAPRRFAFLSPWLDVSGMEADWFAGGAFHPSSDEDLSFWRAMSYQKPCLLLVNTDFSRLKAEQVEQCFRRCLFYGVFPSFFSANAQDHPYWKNPEWVERDRPLFKKYVPLIRRAARAGWQPETRASCDNADLWIERFGPDGDGISYLTVLNATDAPQRGRLTIAPDESPSRESEVTLRELLSGAPLPTEDGKVSLSLSPGDVRLIEVQTRAK